jgi:hypothetical protein
MKVVIFISGFILFSSGTTAQNEKTDSFKIVSWINKRIAGVVTLPDSSIKEITKMTFQLRKEYRAMLRRKINKLEMKDSTTRLLNSFYAQISFKYGEDVKDRIWKIFHPSPDPPIRLQKNLQIAINSDPVNNFFISSEILPKTLY